MTKGKQYIEGMKAGVPVIFGFIPVGIAFAIAARQSGFSILETQLMSLSVFAGASQMMSVGMWAEGAGIVAIVIATLIINLRHIIMSTCVMQRLGTTPLYQRLLAAFGVTDESFAVFTSIEAEKCTMAYFFGLITVTYSSWNVGTLLGALGADLLPEVLTVSFGVALYAMFIVIVTPSAAAKPSLALLVLLTAVVNWMLGLVVDSSWAMIIATLLCALIGVFFVDLDEDGGKKERSNAKTEGEEMPEVSSRASRIDDTPEENASISCLDGATDCSCEEVAR